MKEQVISHKVGNRTGMAGQRRSGAAVQRPTRRVGGESVATRLRGLLGYLPAFLKLALAIIAGVLMFAGYRAAASASFFELRTVEIQGTSRAASEEVQTIVRREVEKTGVWNADLHGINSRLEKLPWVRTAVVSRVLPDGIRVRIAERIPRAVVRTSSGRFRWIDDDAVLLGEMQPTDQIPAFFMRGLNEEDSNSARKENRDRVKKFMELQQEWDAAGLSERVSEVNVIDIRDIRAQLAGDNSQIEVRLGAQDHGKRLKDALNVLDSQREMPHGPMISYIDLSQGKRAIVGLVSGAHASVDGALIAATSSDPAVEKRSERSSAGPTQQRTASETARALDAKPERKPDRGRAEKKPEKPKEPVRRRT